MCFTQTGIHLLCCLCCQEMFQGLQTMEDEDFEVEQMMRRHKKAGGTLLGNGRKCEEV